MIFNGFFIVYMHYNDSRLGIYLKANEIVVLRISFRLEHHLISYDRNDTYV